MHLPVNSLEAPFQDGETEAYELSVICVDGATMDSGKYTPIYIRLTIWSTL